MPRARAHADRVEHPLRRGDRAGRVAGIVEPEQQGTLGVGGIDRVEVEVPLVVDRNRHRAQTGEQRAHLVGGVRDRRVEDGVARRVTQRERTRQRRHQLLGADARDDVVGRDRTAEAALDPPGRGLAQARAADGGRIPGGAGRGGRQRARARRAAWGRRGCRPTRRSCRRAPRPRPRARGRDGRGGTAVGRRPSVGGHQSEGRHSEVSGPVDPARASASYDSTRAPAPVLRGVHREVGAPQQLARAGVAVARDRHPDADRAD